MNNLNINCWPHPNKPSLDTKTYDVPHFQRRTAKRKCDPPRLLGFWGGGGLVVRIARPTSLAIWHRRCSQRRPNRSGSPNRRHFASLDLKKHPDFSYRRPTSQDFRGLFFLAFSCDFRTSECVFTSLAKKLFRIASDLGMCDSNRIAHRGCIARFGPLRGGGGRGSQYGEFGFPDPNAKQRRSQLNHNWPITGLGLKFGRK